MSDKETLYLPEELLEWMEQQKSEFLAWVLEKRPSDDIGFEIFEKFQDLIPEVLETPDQRNSRSVDGKEIVFLSKHFAQVQRGIHGIVVAVKVVVEDESDAEVLLPILFVPTKNTDWAKNWFGESKPTKPLLH